MMKRLVQTLTMVVVLLVCTASGVSLGGAQGDPARPVASAASQRPAPAANAVLTAEMCTAARLSGTIPVTAIGEPVAAVTLAEPVWQTEAGTAPAYCRVDGSMAPVSAGPTARPIQFRVLLPASWNHRAAQLGGGGMNGVIPNLAGNDNTTGAPLLARGFVTFGSDSGHQAGGPPRGGAPAAASPAVNTTSDWAVNDEAIRNLGYMQMKKTRDAAMVIVERAYGARPQFTYYFGTSQGGREALTVAQRYPADYDAIVANVPIVSFSSLMLGPHLIRIEEKPAARWVPRAKIAAIRAEFLRQCDGLDALTDGIINNYQACRAIFDVSIGAPGRRPWAARRCAGGVDPAPADTTAAACLTDGQIATLEFTYRRYPFKAPLAFGVQSFGMWVPTTDPGGSGLLVDMRFRGQEGAAENAPVHSHLGVLGVTGFLMRDLTANPLDYVEGGGLAARRAEISPWLDATNPDLSAFRARGGKMIVTVGTDDSLASSGAQLDYYQSVIDRMGRATVETFARFFVLPQANHGLRGTTATIDGNGQTITATPIPTTYDRLSLIQDWAERNVAPPMSVTVTAGDRSLPLCSFPRYRSTSAAQRPPRLHTPASFETSARQYVGRAGFGPANFTRIAAQSALRVSKM